MSPKPWDEMTPDEQQQLMDDFCEAWAMVTIGFRDCAAAIAKAFNRIPAEIQVALLAEYIEDVGELPDPDYIYEKPAEGKKTS